MHELPRRLFASPRLAGELALATIFINLLALADTVYVMILLRRYIAYGFDGTLFLLTGGALAAVGLQFGLLAARRTLAARVGHGEDERLAERVHDALTGATMAEVSALPDARLRRTSEDLDEVQASCDPAMVCSLLDGPFSLMFALAVWFLSPLLAGVVLLGIAVSALTGWLGARAGLDRTQAYLEAAGQGRSLLASTTVAGDSVRAFRGQGYYRELFLGLLSKAAGLRRGMEETRGLSQAITMGAGVFVRVGLYAIGAKLVVDGQLTVAALIGVSILGSYAIAKASGMVLVATGVARAARAKSRLDELLDLPSERAGGERPATFGGELRLKGVGFSFGNEPLITGLDLALPPGGVLAVRGFNGSGKTTFLRLLAGLLEPTEGSLLIDGTPLTDIDLGWWRGNISYMPQEPFFLGGTIRENILVNVTDPLDAENSPDLRELVRRAGLREFMDTSEKGVETPLVNAGQTLPVGTRKRLALARALATDGRLVLLDEPTAGMDDEGSQAVYAAMNAMLREGRTIVVVSGDPKIVKGAKVVLDLGEKPVPAIVTRKAAEGGAQ